MKKVLFIFSMCVMTILSCSKKYSSYEDLPPCRLNANEMDFTLDFPGLNNIPVVKLRLAGKDYFVVIDTACESGMLFDITENDITSFLKIVHENDGDYAKITDYIEGSEIHLKIPIISRKEIFAQFAGPASKLNGILGLPILKKHQNVVFDYKKRKIYFDSEPITKNGIPMYDCDSNNYTIDFYSNGKLERGIIDTGCDLFMVRNNFNDGSLPVDSKTYNSFYKNNIGYATRPQTEEITFILDEIIIGDLCLKKITAMEGSCKGANATWRVINATAYYSLIGSSVFTNRVIQLDFNNGIFRIK